MKKVYSVIILVLFFNGISAQELNNKFEQGNAAYREAKYDKAVELYTQILAEAKDAPELYFNLGNAYYRQNMIALSVLNYEKALLLAPDDEAIKHNLERANLLVKQKIEPIPEFFLSVLFLTIRNLFSVEFWTVSSITFFIIMLVLASVFVFSSNTRKRKLSFLASIVFLLLFGFSFIFGFQAKKAIVIHKKAIVMKPSVDAQSSPDNLGVTIFTLSEGVKIEITNIRQDWVEIRLADGKIAWLPADIIELI